MKRKALDRVEVKRLIVTAFLTAEKVEKRHAMTCARIAKMLGRTPSTKLRQILAEMVVNETLICEKLMDEKSIGGFVIIYALNPEKYKKPEPQKREIKINGQLGLWG